MATRRAFLQKITTFSVAIPILGRPILQIGPRVTLLTKYLPFQAHQQGMVPDCTAHASALAVEVLNGIEYLLFDAPSPKEVDVSYLHAKGMVRDGDGAAVEDTVKILKKGFIWKQGEYRPRNYKKYINASPKLDARIKTARQVSSWEEAANAVKSLQPVVVSANISFKNARLDNDGFIEPTGNKWGHAWCLVGIDDRYRRPGGLLVSSWGPTWPVGSGSRHNQPRGSAWVDAKTLDLMLSTYGKSYAISDLEILNGQENNRQVIYYCSPTCGPCQRYKPIIAKFPEIETKETGHSVSPVPQVWIVENGQVVDTLVGLQTEETLRRFLEQ